jgi:protein phosphatase
MEPQVAIWDHCLQHAARTDIGLRRANNQDSYSVALAGSAELFQQKGHLFVVADGMGAHAAGELASRIATDVVPLTYQKLADRDPPDALVQAICEANSQIHARGQGEPEFKGMGTTCTALALLPQGALVAHVGDSRAYRLRGTRIEQLTFDHSLLWEVRRTGQFGEEPLAGLIGKNIITRSLGPNPSVSVDLEGPLPIEVGDIFLLCSDGLSGQVKDDEIGAVLLCLPPDEAADALVDLAKLRGGPDNITVIVVKVTAPQVASNATAPTSADEQTRPLPPVNPIVWVVLGVPFLAAIFFAALRFFVEAAACLVLTGVAAIGSMLYRQRQRQTSSDPASVVLGRGPYASADCAPNASIVDRFRDIAEQLRQGAADEHWPVDTARFEQHCRQASAAGQAGNYTEAARGYLRAIRLLMTQLKGRHPDMSTDHKDSVL